ncbi:hypothetical protein Pelo_11765 [Pelomyxa schiedti]|nr:hypothetical protein Pelo_11765 [Pelomyxa schiedti]
MNNLTLQRPKHKIKTTLSMWATLPLLLLVAVASVDAWGPVTHQSLTFSEGEYEFLNEYSFQLGTYSPDAFTSFSFAWHNLEYAGYQLKFATEVYNSTDPDFDPITWSMGYGAHLANDVVGFHPGGWLRDSNFNNIFVSTDTYQYINTPQLEYRYYSPYVTQIADFFSKSTEWYAQSHPGTATVTASEVKMACNLYDKYSASFLVTVINNTDYQNILVASDPYHPADWTQCEEQLKMQLNCQALVADFWINNTLLKVGPKELQIQTNDYTDSLYAAGTCAPLPPKRL